MVWTVGMVAIYIYIYVESQTWRDWGCFVLCLFLFKNQHVLKVVVELPDGNGKAQLILVVN